MPMRQKYGRQSPFSGTLVQRAILDFLAARRNMSLSALIREMINHKYGLVDEESINGVTPANEEEARAAVAQYFADVEAETER